VAVKWIFDEVHSAEARRLRQYPGQLAAPDLMLTEVANVLWKRVGRGDVVAADAITSLERLSQLPVCWHATQPLLVRALDVATTYGRSVYDSVYVALAVREDARLVTADRRLFNALQPTPLARYLCWIEDLPA
jgi:predicted nucleic acid-binding protein